MTTPTVHINGTSKAALEQQYADAYAALNNAIEVVEQAAPNARDYYVQGVGKFSDAADEHGARLAKLASVRDEMFALYEAVADQNGGR